MKSLIRQLVPAPMLSFYHWSLAWIGTVVYRFPSRRLVLIAVTGTKGKSSTTEIIAHILREQGLAVASASTIRFRIGEHVERNLYKMTMPGRFFLQGFLRRAVDAGCTHAVVEMTSEGARQYRHKGASLNALVFTNLAPEHIESHGSFEAYAQAKLSLARAVGASPKRPRVLVANLDDEYGKRFLDVPAEVKAGYALRDAEPYQTDDRSVRFVWRGEVFAVPLPGLFNLYNCLAALTLCEALGVPLAIMKRALEHMPPIDGRAQRVEAGQPFDVVVDYAHTMESLRALYETFKSKRVVAIIGATGGGRDARRRAERGALAEEYADLTFITDEDPYDEDPHKILDDLAAGFTNKKPQIIPDRRTAIAKALAIALSWSKGSEPLDKTRGQQNGVAVLLTGKGTDPYIMRAGGSKEPWSDFDVAAEELRKLGYH
jgi:UDP-N-acetylmuramoyl-L-alanyl-D-glutamate--2,6-diaminopimelate ligase